MGGGGGKGAGGGVWGRGWGGIKASFFPAFEKTAHGSRSFVPPPRVVGWDALSTRNFTDVCFQNLCVRNTDVLSYVMGT